MNTIIVVIHNAEDLNRAIEEIYPVETDMDEYEDPFVMTTEQVDEYELMRF